MNGFGESLYWIIFGGIMGVAPGTVAMSSFREMYGGNASSGISLFSRALLSGLAIAMGVFACMLLFQINLFDSM